MVLFKLLERSLGLISTLILVRLLAPADFGTIAMATSFITMAELLAAFGFDVALIQNQDATELHYHTAWTCNVLLGLSITAFMVVVAQPISTFYHQPELRWVVWALALGPAIGGLENIGVVAFRKELNFRREFMFQISKKSVGFLITVPTAIWLRDYRALVIGMLCSRSAGTVMSYLVQSFRPHFSLARVHDLLHFSKWLLISNILAFLKERSSDFILGRMRGAGELGLYNVSYEFANLPTTELSAPINRALLPGFAKIASEHDALRSTYTHAVAALATMAFPAAAGIWSLAGYIVPVVLGPKWTGAVPLLGVLAVSGGIALLHSSMAAVLIGTGHPRSVAKGNAFFVVFLLCLMLALVPALGGLGAAFAILGATVLATPVYLRELRVRTGIPVTAFVRPLERPFMSAVAMAVALRLLVPAYRPSLGTLDAAALLIEAIALGAVLYAASLMLLWVAARRPPGIESLAIEHIRGLVRSLRGRRAS